MPVEPSANPSPDPNPFEPPSVARARPGRYSTGASSLLWHVFGSVAVVLAGFVAFVGTCLPIAVAPEVLGADRALAQLLSLLGCVVGVGVGILVGSGVRRRIFRPRPGGPTPPGDEVGR